MPFLNYFVYSQHKRENAMEILIVIATILGISLLCKDVLKALWKILSSCAMGVLKFVVFYVYFFAHLFGQTK